MRGGPQWIVPQWPAPPNVRAASTLRSGGVSRGGFDSFNLAAHVGDDPLAVLQNRRALRTALDLATEPLWLNQVHGIDVMQAPFAQPVPTADACVAHVANQVCVIMTADCLPVLFCDRQGTCVGAAHAGWRGLVQGVLSATVRAMNIPASQMLAWLGPAIEADAFEVGSEVRDQFLARDPGCAAAFVPNQRGRWQADLYQLARHELRTLGINAVYGGEQRCFADSQRFFSYRRDRETGRMASLVWMTRPAGLSQPRAAAG